MSQSSPDHCSICGSPRIEGALYCKECSHYDVWLNRHWLASWLTKAFVVAVVTSIGGVGIDYILKLSDHRRATEEQRRAAVIKQFEARLVTVQAVREQSAAILGRMQESTTLCISGDATECARHFDEARLQARIEMLELVYLVPTAFAGEERHRASAAIDNTLRLARHLALTLHKFDAAVARCQVGEVDDADLCHRREEKRRELTGTVAHCLQFLACFANERELGLYNELARHSAVGDVAGITGDTVVDRYCSGILADQGAVCGVRFNDASALEEAVAVAAGEP